MKVLFTTDVHGHRQKYEMIRRLIDDHDILIMGADILPKHTGDPFYHQPKFVQESLPMFFESIGIPILIDFGNDDHAAFHLDFLEMVNEFDHVHSTHLNQVVFGEYSFIGMHFVPDYPFALKDWCRRENKDMVGIDPNQFGPPLFSSRIKYDTIGIDELERYYLSLPSIAFCLNAEKPKTDKVIYNIHAPPKMLGLDVCSDGRRVGSTAVTEFILFNNPMLTLHGHIHESYYQTGQSIGKLGRDTISIQPGQSEGHGDLVYCEFNLEDIEGSYVRKETTWKDRKSPVT